MKITIPEDKDTTVIFISNASVVLFDFPNRKRAIKYGLNPNIKCVAKILIRYCIF